MTNDDLRAVLVTLKGPSLSILLAVELTEEPCLTVNQISHLTGYSLPVIRKWLDWLNQKGWIVKKSGVYMRVKKGQGWQSLWNTQLSFVDADKSEVKDG